MTKENMTRLIRSFGKNISVAKDSLPNGNGFLPIAQIATIIDFMNGDIEGLPSPLSELARKGDGGAFHPTNSEAAADPAPVATDAMKKLGSLGLQSLSELKGYKVDDNNHVLLHVKGRLADSGWTAPSLHLEVLREVMNDRGLPFPDLDANAEP